MKLSNSFIKTAQNVTFIYFDLGQNPGSPYLRPASEEKKSERSGISTLHQSH